MRKDSRVKQWSEIKAMQRMWAKHPDNSENKGGKGTKVAETTKDGIDPVEGSGHNNYCLNCRQDIENCTCALCGLEAYVNSAIPEEDAEAWTRSEASRNAILCHELLTRIESAIKATNGVLRLRLATQSVSMARLLNRIRRSLWLIAGAGFTLLLIDIILDHGGIF
jgi:hypothetical protein